MAEEIITSTNAETATDPPKLIKAWQEAGAL